MPRRFVSYLSVSTDWQGRSGLGLEAQRAAVAAHLSGGDWTLLDEMVEVESGKDTADRPQLARAMALCRLTGAPLCAAKLDRRSRDAHFLIGLDKADVDFVAVDGRCQGFGPRVHTGAVAPWYDDCTSGGNSNGSPAPGAGAST